MGLIQSVIEKCGIPTVSVSQLKEVTEKVSPPRALFVDTQLGYPLGQPHQPGQQKRILVAALELLSEGNELPLLREYEIDC